MISPLTFYKCLADDTRLRSLLLICLRQELCVCELQQALNQSQPKVSRHLAELRKCGMLADERRGKWVYYRLNPELPGWARGVISDTASHNPDYLADCLDRLTRCSAETHCNP